MVNLNERENGKQKKVAEVSEMRLASIGHVSQRVGKRLNPYRQDISRDSLEGGMAMIIKEESI